MSGLENRVSLCQASPCRNRSPSNPRRTAIAADSFETLPPSEQPHAEPLSRPQSFGFSSGHLPVWAKAISSSLLRACIAFVMSFKSNRCFGFPSIRSKMVSIAARLFRPFKASRTNVAASCCSTLRPSVPTIASSALSAFSKPRVGGRPAGFPDCPGRKPFPVIPPGLYCFALFFVLFLRSFMPGSPMRFSAVSASCRIGTLRALMPEYARRYRLSWRLEDGAQPINPDPFRTTAQFTGCRVSDNRVSLIA